MNQRKTVLLADADPNFCALLKELLEETGEFSVYTVQDGREALQFLQKQVPDLLLLDLILHSMNGFQLLQEVQAMEKRPTAIVLSSIVTYQAASMSAQLGARFLPKPFSAAYLLQAIRAHSQPQGPLFVLQTSE